MYKGLIVLSKLLCDSFHEPDAVSIISNHSIKNNNPLEESLAIATAHSHTHMLLDIVISYQFVTCDS